MGKNLIAGLLAGLVLCAATAWAEDAAPAAGAPVIPAEDMAGLEAKVGTGEEVIVEGVIKAVGKTGDGQITFLNFGERKTGFVAVVFAAAYGNFPDGLDKFAQQKVRIRGPIEKYRDKQMQIRIVTPDQIEIIAAQQP
jgi:hypothetical protein